VAYPLRSFHADFCSVLVRLSLSVAGLDIVELAEGGALGLDVDCGPAADAASALTRSRPVASARDAFLFIVISFLERRPMWVSDGK
jgi:hypothetical protein